MDAIVYPGRLSEEQIKQLRDFWSKVHHDTSNAFKPAILGDHQFTARDAVLSKELKRRNDLEGLSSRFKKKE